MQRLKIGLVGTSQLSFPGDKAAAYTHCADGMRALSARLGFDLVVYNDTIIKEEDAVKAVSFMESKKIDFLMVQHTSYSAGHLAPALAKIKGARVGFWAIPEGADTGVVPFNSFCSINMHMGIVAHYLKDYHIKVKWFFGYPDDNEFMRRLKITVRALNAIKNLCASRVALVGGIAPGFNDLYDDERNFLRMFDGMRFNRLHEYSEIKDRALGYDDAKVADTAQKMIDSSGGILNEHAKETMLVSARIYMAYREFIDEFEYDAIALSCWPKFQEDFKYSVCSVVGQLNDEGTVMACEGDVLSAISMLALKYIAGGDPTMLMDMGAFDVNDDSVLLWHCGPAASHFCKQCGYKLSVNYHGMAHEPGKGITSCSGVTRDMVFDESDVTVMRLSGECDKMLIAGGRFMGNAKVSFNGSRGWMNRLTWNGESINARDLVNSVLVNGFQHHFPVVQGNYIDELKEMAAWLGLNPIAKIPYADYLQLPI